MSLTLVNNGDSGLVARDKINAAITAVNNLILSGSGTSGTSGVRGASTWTPEMTNVTQSLTDSNTFTKTAGGAAFNGEVYSLQGYSRGAYVTAKPAATNTDIFFGLSSNPTGSTGFNNIDYAIYLSSTAAEAVVYENGASVTSAGIYNTSSILYITYDGVNVRYFNDGNLVRTTPRAIGAPLHLDASFFQEGSSLTNFAFGPMGESGVVGSNGTSGTSGVNGTSGTSGTSATGGTGGVAGTFASYQPQASPPISGSITSGSACSAIASNFQFTTYMTKSGSNELTTPQVGDTLFSDEAKTQPLSKPSASADPVYYGYLDGMANAFYEINNFTGSVTAIGLCSPPPPPPPPPPALTSFTIYTAGGAPGAISGSADSAAACGEITAATNLRTAYLQKTAPNTGESVEVNDLVFEDAAGTNPIDSFNGSSWYGFTVVPGAVPKSFNVTGVTGEVVTVNFC
jgi:hypothetical protein